ncbi:hypothetical protein [Psychrobacter aquaticus]|uniref:Uncharacterized protein n=1 Tax=Psychrobacter aquaticus CMS 56 TaxID=1354303 RepID=U4TCE8_9GAMM|nr:hypothetical protein [Psychrobacter aquaticus]ERL56138.1 hypothetical protein M917_0816 [Psychrobacter aquaticus CMS 56]
MAISSCLKMQLNNDPININKFTDSGFQFAIDAVAGSKIDDLKAFSHLSLFFNGFTEWYYVTPPLFPPEFDVFIGTIIESDKLLGHPDTSLSLACFTEQTLKDEIANKVPTVGGLNVMPLTEWFDLIQNTDIADLNTVISANAPNADTDISIITQPSTLKIMRCTQAEIDGLYEPDFPPYVDAFDIVKSCLANNIAVLNSKGLAPAVYHSDGDYIEFTAAACAMQITQPLDLPR